MLASLLLLILSLAMLLSTVHAPAFVRYAVAKAAAKDTEHCILGIAAMRLLVSGYVPEVSAVETLVVSYVCTCTSLHYLAVMI